MITQLLADNFTNWIDDIRTKVGSVFSSFSMNTISIIICSLFLFMTIVSFIVVMCSVETKSFKTFNKMYNYFSRHPEITKDNLVEFNKLMKSRFVPASIRVQWQNYMVNRNLKPSEFLSEDRIVDKPLKSSKYKTTIKFYNFVSLLIAGIGFLLGLFFFWGENIGVLDALFLSALSPMAILILTVLVNAIISYRYNTIVTYLYENVEQLGKSLDAACVNMPEFVDYEILFTPKEIKQGIPVLQEFLRQRAKKEQEAIEKAKQSEVEGEKYNFEDLGVDGSLVMDKAMKESEHYLSNRRRFLAEIEQIESEKDLISRNFDDKSKVSQRKLRDVKDNQQRLKEKLDLTTNKIMANELRKQQSDEVKKQQAIEKEIDEDNEKFLQEIKKLDGEIQKRKDEIEKSRKYVENVLKSEFKTYSDKIYSTLSDEVGENLSVQMVKFNKEKAELEQRIVDNNNFVNERDALYQDKLREIEQLNELLLAKENEIQSLNSNITNAQQAINVKHKDRKDLIDALNIRNQQCQDLTNAVNERDMVIKKQEEIIKDMTFAMEQEKHRFAELKNEKETEIHHYYDAMGREFFYDINDRPFFYDETGKVVYYDEANLDHLIKINKKNAELQAINLANSNLNKQEEIKNEEDKVKPVMVANESFFDDINEAQKPQETVEDYDDFFNETDDGLGLDLDNDDFSSALNESVEESYKPQKAESYDEFFNTNQQVDNEEDFFSKVPNLQESEAVAKEDEPQPIEKPKAEKKEPTLSLSERRALKLAKMQEARKPAAKKVEEKPEAKEVKQPVKAQKVEPEKSLAEKRAEKLAAAREKASNKNKPTKKAETKKQEEKVEAKPKTPAKTTSKTSTEKTSSSKVTTKPKAVEEKKETSQKQTKTPTKTTAKKSNKKEFLSDAEVFEQAFKDLDMAAFNEKLSNVFEQIDAQAKSSKKKK